MFMNFDHFRPIWENETKNTLKLLECLTDESLSRPEHPDIRSLGKAAWHIVTTYPEMMKHINLKIEGPDDKSAVPKSVAEIIETYKKYTQAVFECVSRWSDDDFQTEAEFYGETWKWGQALWILLLHEIHHRGQLTIMMRLADLTVTGLYGPAKEEWEKYGMKAPVI